jgi:hypothetical protein
MYFMRWAHLNKPLLLMTSLFCLGVRVKKVAHSLRMVGQRRLGGERNESARTLCSQDIPSSMLLLSFSTRFFWRVFVFEAGIQCWFNES